MREYIIKEHGVEYTVEEYNDGSKFWHLGRNFHREYGPAAEFLDNNKWWHKGNLQHRDDGRAVYWDVIDGSYYLSGSRFSFYDLLFYEERERDKK